MSKTIEKELVSHLIQLEMPQQEKVIQFIKHLLAEGGDDFAYKLSAGQIAAIKKGAAAVRRWTNCTP